MTSLFNFSISLFFSLTTLLILSIYLIFSLTLFSFWVAFFWNLSLSSLVFLRSSLASRSLSNIIFFSLFILSIFFSAFSFSILSFLFSLSKLSTFFLNTSISSSRFFNLVLISIKSFSFSFKSLDLLSINSRTRLSSSSLDSFSVLFTWFSSIIFFSSSPFSKMRSFLFLFKCSISSFNFPICLR